MPNTSNPQTRFATVAGLFTIIRFIDAIYQLGFQRAEISRENQTVTTMRWQL
jgi:hypothetical protein